MRRERSACVQSPSWSRMSGDDIRLLPALQPQVQSCFSQAAGRAGRFDFLQVLDREGAHLSRPRLSGYHRDMSSVQPPTSSAGHDGPVVITVYAEGLGEKVAARVARRHAFEQLYVNDDSERDARWWLIRTTCDAITLDDAGGVPHPGRDVTLPDGTVLEAVNVAYDALAEEMGWGSGLKPEHFAETLLAFNIFADLKAGTRAPTEPPSVLDERWTDEEGRPLGGWVKIGRDEYRATIAHAGGLEALSVFSTLTDPEGVYGAPRVYTAWGRRDAAHPLVDVDDLKENGITVETTFRRFVTVPATSRGGR